MILDHPKYDTTSM